MKNVSSIAAIALASSLALLATGCDRTPDDRTPGERADMDARDTPRDTTTSMGETLDRRTDQAGQATTPSRAWTSTSTPSRAWSR